MYSHLSHMQKRLLWADIHRLNLSCLMVVDDFHAVLSAHERRSSVLPLRTSCDDLLGFLNDCSLLHIPTTGKRFTRAGRRHTRGSVESRIDRSLISQPFHDLWHVVRAHVLPRTCSDHSPLAVFCTLQELSGFHPFRFQNMWTLHASFLDFVRQSWSSPLPPSNPIVQVMGKLSRC